MVQERKKTARAERTGVKGRRAWTAAVISLCVISFAGCGMPGKPPAAVSTIKASPVKTEPVAKHSIGSPVEQVADTVSGTTLDVIPKVSGEVKEVLKKKGDRVQKGDVLFVIDDTDARSAQNKAELSVRSAQHTLDAARQDKGNNRKDLADAVTKTDTAYRNAQQDFNKLHNDYDAGLVTQRQLDQAQDSVNNARMAAESAKNKLDAFDRADSITSAELQLENAQLTLSDATRALENYNVKAPGDGILTDFNVVAGQTVSAAAGKVGQVQQVDPIKLKTELTESSYQLVQGKKELVYYDPTYPDKKAKAAVSYLAPIVSATSKTYTLEMLLPNPEGQLQPGKRYMVQLTSESEEQVLAIPSLSVIREDSDTYVFVEEGGLYHKRKVKLGRINAEFQEVLDGLKEGEKLVVTGQSQMKDGQKVENPAQAETAKPTEAPAKK